jgi:hypothetical protein
MMAFTPPLLAVIGVVIAVFVFALPQCFEAAIAYGLISRFGASARFWMLCAPPFTAILTWYCYDYLTPTDFNLGINTPADWTSYQHGLTGRRYLMALAAQAPLTVFSLLFLDARLRGRSRKILVLLVLALAGILGIVWGHHLATGITRPLALS